MKKNQIKPKYSNKCDSSKVFAEVIKKNQRELKVFLTDFLIDNGYNVISQKRFLYAKGDVPILLTAHLDTVHKERVKRINQMNLLGREILKSPQGIGGDDRCGVWIIMELIKKGFRPYILFCEDEEIGCKGSNEFSFSEYIEELQGLKYMIGLDRKGKNDAVFYNCENFDFEEYILNNTGFKKAYGSFSDISILAPAAGIAAVNLSCGYYDAHTKEEYIDVLDMKNTIDVVAGLLKKAGEADTFEYVEAAYDEDFYDDFYSYFEEKTLQVFLAKDGSEELKIISGKTEDECWKKFFMSNPNVCYNDVLDYDCF